MFLSRRCLQGFLAVAQHIALPWETLPWTRAELPRRERCAPADAPSVVTAPGAEGIRASAQGPRSPAKGCLRIRAVCNQVTKLKVTFLRNAFSLLHLGADREFCGYSVDVSTDEIFQQQNTEP